MEKWKQRSGISLVLVVITVTLVISAKVPVDYADSVVIKPFADDPSRLPTNVIPVHYDLNLRAMTGSKFSGERAYTGSVKIHIRIVSNTNSITLHNRGLTITNIILTGVGGGTPITTTYSIVTNYDFLVIDTSSTILSQGQEFTLQIDFSGNMRTDNGGFYRSSYRANGETLSRYINY